MDTLAKLLIIFFDKCYVGSKIFIRVINNSKKFLLLKAAKSGKKFRGQIRKEDT